MVSKVDQAKSAIGDALEFTAIALTTYREVPQSYDMALTSRKFALFVDNEGRRLVLVRNVGIFRLNKVEGKNQW